MIFLCRDDDDDDDDDRGDGGGGGRRRHHHSSQRRRRRCWIMVVVITPIISAFSGHLEQQRGLCALIYQRNIPVKYNRLESHFCCVSAPNAVCSI